MAVPVSFGRLICVHMQAVRRAERSISPRSSGSARLLGFNPARVLQQHADRNPEQSWKCALKLASPTVANGRVLWVPRENWMFMAFFPD